MRTSVLLFVMVLPALAACGAAWAGAPTTTGKPVCTQYDDNAKPAPRQPTDASAMTTPATSQAVALTTPSAGISPAAQAKGGATSVLRPHGAPRWQTLLPGMFR